MRCLVCDEELQRMERVIPVLLVQYTDEVNTYTHPHPTGHVHLRHLKEVSDGVSS